VGEKLFPLLTSSLTFLEMGFKIGDGPKGVSPLFFAKVEVYAPLSNPAGTSAKL